MLYLAKTTWPLILLLTAAIAAAQEAEPFPFNSAAAIEPLAPARIEPVPDIAPHGDRRPAAVQPALYGDEARSYGNPPNNERARVAAPATKTNVGLSPPAGEKRLPLARPDAAAGKPARAGPSIVTLLGSLAMVLGLFFVVTWIMRRGASPLQTLPPAAFEVLGRAPLAGRQHAHLIRCGNKLLLVSLTAAGADTLTEITDPAEVDRLSAICQQGRPPIAATAFRQIFSQFATDRTGAAAGKTAVTSRRLTPAALEDDDDV